MIVTVMHETERIYYPHEEIRISPGVTAIIETVRSRETTGPWTKTVTECSLLVNASCVK